MHIEWRIQGLVNGVGSRGEGHNYSTHNQQTIKHRCYLSASALRFYLIVELQSFVELRAHDVGSFSTASTSEQWRPDQIEDSKHGVSEKEVDANLLCNVRAPPYLHTHND